MSTETNQKRIDTALQILELLEELDRISNGRHYTIFRFTTHWKVMFGTPYTNMNSRLQIHELEPGNDLQSAIQTCIANGQLDKDRASAISRMSEEEAYLVLKTGR